MINKDRIVPIQKIDFLSLIGTILTLMQTSYTALAVEEGVAYIDDDSLYLANEPVKSIDFTDATGDVIFVAAHDFAGITVSGEAATMASASEEVVADGVTLQVANLTSGEVTVSYLTPVAE